MSYYDIRSKMVLVQVEQIENVHLFCKVEKNSVRNSLQI